MVPSRYHGFRAGFRPTSKAPSARRLCSVNHFAVLCCSVRAPPLVPSNSSPQRTRDPRQTASASPSSQTTRLGVPALARAGANDLEQRLLLQRAWQALTSFSNSEPRRANSAHQAWSCSQLCTFAVQLEETGQKFIYGS